MFKSQRNINNMIINQYSRIVWRWSLKTHLSSASLAVRLEYCDNPLQGRYVFDIVRQLQAFPSI